MCTQTEGDIEAELRAREQDQLIASKVTENNNALRQRLLPGDHIRTKVHMLGSEGVGVRGWGRGGHEGAVKRGRGGVGRC
jgi:hypothetical protein